MCIRDRRQCGAVGNLDPAAVRAEDALLAEHGQAARELHPADAENIRKVVLGHVNDTAVRAGLLCRQQVKQVAQLEERAVVFLMRGFIQQQVDI